MADGADATGKLSKLARLKSLKSGLKASEKPTEDDSSDLSLDAMLAADEPASVAAPKAPVPEARAAEKPAPEPAPKAGKPADADGESLTSYFEALGIVPDGAKVSGATGKAPTKYSAPSDAYTAPAPKNEPGRDVDERDLWADPVRNDDTFLSSFTAGAAAQPEPEDDSLSLDSIIGSFDDDVDAEPEAKVEVAPDVVAEPEPDPLDRPVDIEAFEAEIALKDSEMEMGGRPVDTPLSASTDNQNGVQSDQPLTITFDESRATLLTHVSKQMSCSIDDVVVTAIDWYLDALFGEDDPDLAATQGD